MATGRMLNRSISTSPKVAELANDTHRLVFTWSIAHLDRDGRMSGDPRELRARVAPLLEHVTTAVAAAAIADIIGRGLAIAYLDENGRGVVAYPGFGDEQRGLRPEREAASRFGAPPGDPRRLLGIVPSWLSAYIGKDSSSAYSGVTPASVRPSAGQMEWNGNEINGMEMKDAREARWCSSAQPENQDSPAPAGPEQDGSDPSGSANGTTNDAASAAPSEDLPAARTPEAPDPDAATPARPDTPDLPDAEPSRPPPEHERVFAEYLIGWHRAHPKAHRPPMLDDKRRKLIRARLRDFDVEDLVLAARGIWQSKWHVDSDQTDFGIVVRDAAHVEKFRNLATGARGDTGRGRATLDLYAGLYEKSRRRYGAYVAALGDEAVAAKLYAHAAAMPMLVRRVAEGLDIEQEVQSLLAYWMREFLRDDGHKSYLVNARHPLRSLVEGREISTYGTPWDKAPRRPRAEPTETTAQAEVTAPPEARAALAGLGIGVSPAPRGRHKIGSLAQNPTEFLKPVGPPLEVDEAALAERQAVLRAQAAALIAAEPEPIPEPAQESTGT